MESEKQKKQKKQKDISKKINKDNIDKNNLKDIKEQVREVQEENIENLIEKKYKEHQRIQKIFNNKETDEECKIENKKEENLKEDTIKENDKKDNKSENLKIFENVIIGISIMIYFLVLNSLYTNVENSVCTYVIKISCMVILLISILIFEIAYRKDSGKLAINGIEVLVLASHSLSMMYVVEKQKFDFTLYILTSSYVFAIYYILKSTIIYTIDKRKKIKDLSDIREIVGNQPTKKEAKKRKNKTLEQ